MKMKIGKAQTAQSKALESIQRRAMSIIFLDNDYDMTLILAGQDTYLSRGAPSLAVLPCTMVGVACSAGSIRVFILSYSDAVKISILCVISAFERSLM